MNRGDPCQWGLRWSALWGHELCEGVPKFAAGAHVNLAGTSRPPKKPRELSRIQRSLKDPRNLQQPKGHPGIWGREPRALSLVPWALTPGP
eukprot:3699394-Pyramimonas_sp.AAC.1